MSWDFSVNNIDGADGGAEVLYALKEHLKSAGWDVPESADGTTYNSSGDQITHGSSGANGMNNTDAWFRIRAPAAMTPRREFVFQRDATDRAWIGYVSAEDSFVGGAPDATTPPTAVDEEQIIGTGGAADATFFPVNSTYKYHIGADDDGPYGWYAFTAVNGTGHPGTVLVFDPMSSGSYSSADQDPAVYLFESDAATTPFASAKLTATATAPFAWYKKDLAGESFVRMTANTYEMASGQSVPTNAGTDPYSSADPHYPILYMRPSALGTEVGNKGFGSVMRWLGTNRSDMDTLSTGGMRDNIVVGDAVMPWPDTVPSL